MTQETQALHALEFQPRTLPEGCVRVETKICELCGRNFFRDAKQTLCPKCTLRPFLMPRQREPRDQEEDGGQRA